MWGLPSDAYTRSTHFGPLKAALGVPDLRTTFIPIILMLFFAKYYTRHHFLNMIRWRRQRRTQNSMKMVYKRVSKMNAWCRSGIADITVFVDCSK